MNKKAISLIKNFSYTLVSNLVSLLVSILVIIIVPKLIGVEEYGYFQLYLFYSTYVGFLHFGWNDGIYLRYGGKQYKELDKGLFFSQFYMLVLLQIIILLIIFGISSIFVIDHTRSYILKMTALCMLLVNLRYMLMFILQGTNRIKEYARITMIDKLIFSFIIILLLFFRINEVELMVVSDLIGKFVSLIIAMYYCRDIVFRRVSTFYLSLRETIENIFVGIKLMFSNIASNLIVGFVRLGIERSWDITTFGKVSLTLSVSSLVMLFINALSIILFPILRRLEKEELPNIYSSMRDSLMVISLGILIVYYPFKSTLLYWLPQYTEGLVYMAILFPVCLYQGKMSLLINTFLNTLRKEKITLVINLITVLLSAILTIISTVILKNLDITIFSILFLLMFRGILAEIILSRILKVSIYKDTFLEFFMVIIFITVNWFINSWLATLIYFLTYLMYIFIKKKDLALTIQNLKSVIKA